MKDIRFDVSDDRNWLEVWQGERFDDGLIAGTQFRLVGKLRLESPTATLDAKPQTVARQLNKGVCDGYAKN